MTYFCGFIITGARFYYPLYTMDEFIISVRDDASAVCAAAAAGNTTLVEDGLGRVAGGARRMAEVAEKALNVAVAHRRWGAAAYLASYLFDTAKPPRRSEPPVVKKGPGPPPKLAPVTFGTTFPGVGDDEPGGRRAPYKYFNLTHPDKSAPFLVGGGDVVAPSPVRVAAGGGPPLVLRAPAGAPHFTRLGVARALARALAGRGEDLSLVSLVPAAPPAPRPTFDARIKKPRGAYSIPKEDPR